MISRNFHFGEKLYHYLTPGDSSTPLIRAPLTFDRRLSTAVVENWSDEVHAIGDFLYTRGGRHIQRIPIVGALSFAAQTPWRWVRLGSKGALRLVPYVGWVLLAHDLYELGDNLGFY